MSDQNSLGSPAASRMPDYAEHTPHRRKKGATVGIAAAAVAVLLIGGGTYAWTSFNGGGEQPYERLAPGALAYAQTNVNPSADQKLAINELAKKFPEAKSEDPKAYSVFTADNINGALLAQTLDDDKVDNYDFVGDRMAIAAYPDSNDDGEPELAFIAQVEDEESAKKALDKIIATAADDKLELVGEVSDGYLKVTTGSIDAIFASDESLADDGEFGDAMGEVEDNVLSGWGDMGLISEASTSSENYGAIDSSDETPEVDVEGVVTMGLEARSDGLDFVVYSDGVKVNGETFTVDGDRDATAELLGTTSYSDATVNLGIVGLGSMVQKLADSSDFTISSEVEDVSNEDIPALFGDSAAFSARFNDDSTFDVKLALSGVDAELIERAVESEGVAVGDLETALEQQIGQDASVELSGDTLQVTVGTSPEGADSFDAGLITGSVDLDSVYDFASSFGGASEESVDNIGMVTFTADVEDDGDGEAKISWTTTR